MEPQSDVPLRHGWFITIAVLCVFFLLFNVALGPMGHDASSYYQGNCMQQARILALAMFEYANDNDQRYPDGQSSTEVFQKLIDGKYISDPRLLYVPLPGKIRPSSDQKKLQPENISWDVTSGADNTSPDGLPLVFMTGYRVNYSPSSSAVPLIKPYPRFGWVDPHPTWYEFFTGQSPIHDAKVPGIGVAYKSNLVKYLKLETAAEGGSSLPNFIPPDFKPDGKTYRQLTPDGPLP